MRLSGSRNRDVSCFIFKALEEKGFGFRKLDSTTLKNMLKTVSTFVDDTDM